MMKKYGIHTVFIAFLLFVCLICHASADENRIIAVFPTWEPFGYLEDEKPKGFEIEIFSAVMEQMQIQVSFLHFPWKRCLHAVRNRQADVVISALKTEDRESFLIFPDEPISISRTAVFTRSDRDIAYTGDCMDLKAHVIGVVSGFSYGPDFDRCTGLKKDESTQSETILAKVLMSRNDVGIDNIAVISALARKTGTLDSIRFLSPLVHSQNLYAAFSRKPGNDILAIRFSHALSEFKTSAAYRAILAVYGLE